MHSINADQQDMLNTGAMRIPATVLATARSRGQMQRRRQGEQKNGHEQTTPEILAHSSPPFCS
jgi:hypothetical protein